MSQPEAALERPTIDMVREAASQDGKRRGAGGLSMSKSTTVDRIMAPVLGLYLGWVVARVPEVYPQLFVPRLPMLLLLVFLVALAAGVPWGIWHAAWKQSLPFRLVCAIGAIAVVTVPLGIWISGSFEYLRTRYVVSFVIFLACLIFLRDRRTLRTAVTIYCLCVTAVAAKTMVTYNPDELVETASGDLVPVSELNVNYQRLNVSISLDPNDYGAVVATTIPLILWLSMGSFLRRIIWGGAALMIVASVVPTASRGALVGLVAVALTLTAFGATGWKRGLIMLVILAGGTVFAALASEGQLGRFLSFGTDDYNLTNEGRWYFWRQGLVWMVKRPWGYGIDNFSTYFDWLNGRARAAHSSWIQYGMELGVAGLTSFVLLNLSLWRGHRRNRVLGIARRQQDLRTSENESTVSGHFLAMMAGCLATGTFLSNAYYPLMYMMLGLSAAALLGSPFGPQASGFGILSARATKPSWPTDATVPDPARPGTTSRGATRLRRHH